MTANLHLFRIEFRRNAGLWLFPIMLGLAWFISREFGGDRPYGIVLWSEVSGQISGVFTIVGPIIGGVAAWMAGRDRRRRTEDLVASTPRPPAVRDLTGWAATAAWGLLAFMLVGLYWVIEATRADAWGDLDVARILLGVVGVAAFAALGFAAGVFLPSRFTAALTPVVLLVATAIVDARSSSLRHLGPAMLVDPPLKSAFLRLKPELEILQIAWLGGLSGIALAAVALRRRRTAPAWGALLAFTGCAVLSAALLLRIDPDSVYSAAPEEEPICVQRTLVVCVHPAYVPILDETADLVDGLARPLAGLPGVPVRAEQYWLDSDTIPPHPDNLFSDLELPRDTTSGETLWLFPSSLISPEVELDHEAVELVGRLVSDPATPLTEAQAAIAIWLMRQAGIDPAAEIEGAWFADKPASASMLLAMQVSAKESERDIEPLEARITAAAERFAALDPTQQRAWLEANYPALRAGELTLEDLP